MPRDVDLATEAEFRLRDLAVVAYGPTLVSSIGYGAVTPMLALRARDLGADVGTAAFVVSLFGLGMLLASLPSGAIVARLGERRTLLYGGFIDAVAMVAAARATTVLALGIARRGQRDGLDGLPDRPPGIHDRGGARPATGRGPCRPSAARSGSASSSAR